MLLRSAILLVVYVRTPQTGRDCIADDRIKRLDPPRNTHTWSGWPTMPLPSYRVLHPLWDNLGECPPPRDNVGPSYIPKSLPMASTSQATAWEISLLCLSAPGQSEQVVLRGVLGGRKQGRTEVQQSSNKVQSGNSRETNFCRYIKIKLKFCWNNSFFPLFIG